MVLGTHIKHISKKRFPSYSCEKKTLQVHQARVVSLPQVLTHNTT